MTSRLRLLLAAQVPADFADLLDYVAIAALLTSYQWSCEVTLGIPKCDYL